MEFQSGFRPAHRHQPEQMELQKVGAVAAFERDDRAVVYERVLRCSILATVPLALLMGTGEADRETTEDSRGSVRGGPGFTFQEV